MRVRDIHRDRRPPGISLVITLICKGTLLNLKVKGLPPVSGTVFTNGNSDMEDETSSTERGTDIRQILTTSIHDIQESKESKLTVVDHRSL